MYVWTRKCFGRKKSARRTTFVIGAGERLPHLITLVLSRSISLLILVFLISIPRTALSIPLTMTHGINYSVTSDPLIFDGPPATSPPVHVRIM